MKSWQAHVLDGAMRALRLKRLLDDRTVDKFIARNRREGAAPPPPRMHARYDLTARAFRGREVLVVTPKEKHSRKILYLHGGGFVLSLLDVHWRLLHKLSKGLDAQIVVPDYPLAPEHTADQIHEWLMALYEDVVHDSDDRWLVMGDSAGGNLTLSTTIQARDRGLRLPQALVMFSPGLAGERDHPLRTKNDKTDLMIALRGLEPLVRRYAGALDPDTDARILPLLASLRGLPPMATFASDSEVLYLDSVRLKERGEAGEADVSFFSYSGMAHVWPVFPLPEANKAIDEAVAFVKSREPR